MYRYKLKYILMSWKNPELLVGIQHEIAKIRKKMKEKIIGSKLRVTKD